MAAKRDEVDKDATAIASLRAALEKSSDDALRQLAKPLEVIEKRLRSEGKPLALWPLVVFGVLVVAVIAIAIVYGVWLKHHALHTQGGDLVPRYGAFGDALGPAAGALSALAVLAALVSVYFQREELRLTRAEIKEQADHLERSAMAQDRLVADQRHFGQSQMAQEYYREGDAPEQRQARRAIYNARTGQVPEADAEVVASFFHRWGMLAKYDVLPRWVYLETVTGDRILELHSRLTHHIAERRPKNPTYAVGLQWLVSQIKEHRQTDAGSRAP